MASPVVQFSHRLAPGPHCLLQWLDWRVFSGL